MAALRIVLDTHVLRSVDILDELRRVLPRLVHRHGLTVGERDDLIDVLTIQTEVIVPLPSVNSALRDVDDQPVPGTLPSALKASGADYLVTGDKDLFALAGSCPIVSPAEFWAAHGGP
ncbi:MAG: PIN domain-containing protein [Acidiferrobacteraceae bacterium]